MPRYYMHIEQDGKTIEDLEGQSFENIEEARKEAVASAREIMSERVAKGRSADRGVFNIVDDEGRTVLRVPFKDAIEE